MATLDIPSTVTEQVSLAKNLELSYNKLHSNALLKIDDDTLISFPFSSLTNKYKPKMVSEELYGTTEFWDQVLILNNAVSIIDFTPKSLKVYDPEKLKLYLNEILILEENEK